jgi:serine/threonine protein kinase
MRKQDLRYAEAAVSDGGPNAPALEATILSTRLGGTGEAAAADALVGTRRRHFEVKRLLGKGGMGAVYLGTDTSLERPVALKVLAPEIAHDPEVVARFVREARAQARLRHPNVAQIYFIGEDRGLQFFALEFLEGPALDEVVAQRRVPWADALDYTIAAARGLRAALAHGFIHRDVKPSNLILDRESGIKIVDFGLVKSIHEGDAELTRNGAIIGSPIGVDVIRFVLQIFVVPNDVFVIIALPDGCFFEFRNFPNAFGRARFKLCDDRTKRCGLGSTRR